MDATLSTSLNRKHSSFRSDTTFSAENSVRHWHVTVADECRYGAEGMASVLASVISHKGCMNLCAGPDKAMQLLQHNDCADNLQCLIIRLPNSPAEAILWLLHIAREFENVRACQRLVLLTACEPDVVTSVARVIGIPVSVVIGDHMPLSGISRIFSSLLYDTGDCSCAGRIVESPELTPQERVLLTGILTGASVLSQASELGCGINTVYLRRKAIFQKFGVKGVLSLLRHLSPAPRRPQFNFRGGR